VRLLLDSHVLLWWLDDDARLAPVRDIVIAAPMVYVSAATVWELALKSSLGKLVLPGPLTGVLAANHFDELPITGAHAEAAVGLPAVHADPFDRMLVAQAAVERLTLVTHDLLLAKYGGALLKV